MLSIRIIKCPSCDGKHDQVECYEFAVRRAAWTHWYTCPGTGDPVSVLLEVEGGRLYEIEPSIIESLMQARKAGKFVVAVFRQEQIDDNKFSTHCVQHPHDFPTDHFGTCVNLLREAFDKVAGPPPKEEPMRRAKPEPAINLWQPKRPKVTGLDELQQGVALNVAAANLESAGRAIPGDAADSPVVVMDDEEEEGDREEED